MADDKYAKSICFIFSPEGYEEITYSELCRRRDTDPTYLEMPKLTPELLRVFIRKIEVFEKLEKYSRTAGNLIVIHYAFQLPEENGMPILEKILSKQAKTA